MLHVGRSPERILEIECGDGDGVLFLAREFPGARVRGVDPSADRVREATARVGLDPEGRVAFKRGGARALPYPDDFFDLVAQIDVRPVPAEIARVLRPGGDLILASSRRPGAPFGLGSRFLRRRLAHHGIELVDAVDAGGGGFVVARLRGSDRAAVGD